MATCLWDEVVKKQSFVLDGNLGAFEHINETRWNYYSDPEPDALDKPSTLLEQLKWLQEAGLVDMDVFWMNDGHAIFGAYKRQSHGPL